jgi:hypothetical protein
VQQPPRPDEQPNTPDTGSADPVRSIGDALKRAGLGSLSRVWPVAMIIVGWVALYVVAQLPAGEEPMPPPLTTLLAAGIVIAMVGAVSLWAATRAAGLPARAAVAAAGGFASIALAKFTFGPLGFYEFNQERTISLPAAGTESLLIAGTSIVVLALYGSALWLIYALFRRRLPSETRESRGVAVGTLLTGFAFAAVVAAAATIFGGASIYLDFVFASSAAIGIALTLVFATALLSLAFATTAEAAKAAGDAAMLATLFWLSIGFLILFQALWVIYMLGLITIWPLRTVSPK